MTIAVPALVGAQSGGGRRLVAAGLLDPLVAFARATSGRATAPGADGATWAEFAADLPRFAGAARRLLLGGPRGNAVRNPRCEGAVAGTPGVLPTHWTGGTGTGVTRQVVGSGVEDGIGYVDIRWSGAGGQAGFSLTIDSGAAMPAANGETHAGSVFLRVVGGTLSGFGTSTLRVTETGGTATTSFASIAGVSGAALRTQRFAVTRSCNQAGTTGVQLQLLLTPPATAWEVTLRIGWPQCERNAAFAGPPVLPAPAGTGASTQGADLVSAATAALFPGGSGTLLLSATLPQAAAGADQTLLQLDDGTDANRLALRNTAGGSGIGLLRALAGAAATASAGSMTAGTPFRLAASFAAGRLAASLEGAAVQAVAGGPAAGLATLRLGNRADGAAALFGEVGTLLALPFAVPDSALPALSLSLQP
jgi:hypothetical protein